MEEKKLTARQVVEILIDQVAIQKRRIDNLQLIIESQQLLINDLCEAAGMKPQKRTLH